MLKQHPPLVLSAGGEAEHRGHGRALGQELSESSVCDVLNIL